MDDIIHLQWIIPIYERTGCTITILKATSIQFRLLSELKCTLGFSL